MTHDERMHQLLYSNEGRVEQCERICRLEELVRDFDKCLDTALYMADSAGYLTMPDQKLFASLRSRMRELGVEP